jgi:hypothetical protein
LKALSQLKKNEADANEELKTRAELIKNEMFPSNPFHVTIKNRILIWGAS